MTPREKAIELVDKFIKYEPTKLSDYTRIEYPSAINLAKMCVDEILKENHEYDDYNLPLTNKLISRHDYWSKVLIELKEL